LVQLQKMLHGIFFQVKIIAFACIVVDPYVELFKENLKSCEEQLTANDRPQENVLFGFEKGSHLLNDLLTWVCGVKIS